MAGGARSLLRGFVSLFFVMFLHVGHAGCCFSPGSSASASQQHEEDDGAGGKGGGGSSSSKRRKISPLAFSPALLSSTPGKERTGARRRRQVSSLATNLRFYLHRIFSSSSSSGAKSAGPATGEEDAVATTLSSPLGQSMAWRQASVVLSTPSSPCASPFLSPMSPQSVGVTPMPCSPQATRQLSRSFASRCDVFPCKVCGEVLRKPQQLELHQAMKHSLSELSHMDSSMNIIRMIFLAGWKPAVPSAIDPPAVRRILRIHNNPRALSRFEEYRELVRARAARRCAGASFPCGGVMEEERCIADGNERLRFHCATMLCSLSAGVCGSPYCCTCTILRHGFAGKQADVDGIATYSSGRAAHASLPEDLEREFAFMQVCRAMLVCRVVAGRVVRGNDDEDHTDHHKVAYDSIVPVMPAANGGVPRGEDDAELLVFNPRAVLPCFVIIYGS